MSIAYKFLNKKINFKGDLKLGSINKIQSETQIPIKYAKQIHSDNIYILNDLNLDTALIETDAIITKLEGVAIGVYTADCIPFLFSGDGIIGAVHLGRKGIIKGLLNKVIKLLVTQYQIDLNQLKCYLGPSLEFANHTTFYEDSAQIPDKYKYFYPLGAHYINNVNIIDNYLKTNDLSLNSLSQRQSVRLDAMGYIIDSLIQLGVNQNNIACDRIDTFENVNYHSYRRDYPNHGLNFSYIYKTAK